MLTAVWIALGVGVLGVGAGVYVAVSRALRGWRSLKGLRSSVERATSDALAAAEAATGRAAELTEQLERLTTATERLERSLAELRVLGGAAGEVRTAVARLQSTVPRK